MNISQDDRLLSQVLSILDRSIRTKLFPGAVAVLGIVGRDSVIVSTGNQTYESNSLPVHSQTLYDLASLTKVLATTSATLKLAELGEIHLHDVLSCYLPHIPSDKSGITLLHCLTHTAGFRAHSGFLKRCSSPQEVIGNILSAGLAAKPGEKYIYTDMGFILLGHIIEQVTRTPLENYIVQEIFRPLGMLRTTYLPPADWANEIAPTEYDPKYPDTLLQGIVHDEKARLLGGVAGNAGLFSSASDLNIFISALLTGFRQENQFPLSPPSIRQMLQNQLSDSTPQGLGWALNQSFMSGMRPEAFGHTGFTGTSIVGHAGSGRFCILLTNCVHPVRPNALGRRRLLRVRSQISDLISKMS